MSTHDIADFGRELLITAELFGETLSEARTLAYFEALADMPSDLVRRGLGHARRVLKFFPKPAEIRELVAGSVEDRAREAWRRVLGALEHIGTYESVDFRDPILHAVLEALGGWHQAWPWARVDGPELLGLERDFVSLYRLYTQRGPSRVAPPVLLGQHALRNRQLGTAVNGTIPAELVVLVDPIGHVLERRALTTTDPRMLE